MDTSFTDSAEHYACVGMMGGGFFNNDLHQLAKIVESNSVILIDSDPVVVCTWT